MKAQARPSVEPDSGRAVPIILTGGWFHRMGEEVDVPSSQLRLKLLVAISWTAALGVAAISLLQHSTPPARGDDSQQMGVYQNSKERLGKTLFFENNLSNPVGQSCGSCHSAGAGFTFPSSKINEALGVAVGAAADRFSFRKVPTIAYSAYIPTGVPTYRLFESSFSGGLFWDGHATDLMDQVHFPLENPNEMNNDVHTGSDPGMIVRKVLQGPYADQFRQVYGDNAFQQPTAVVIAEIAEAISEYEKSPEVSPFSSKYDAYVLGRAKLSQDELNGLRLVTGSTNGRPGGPPNYKSAQCVLCHVIPSDVRQGPDLWTNSCYANLGVPRNLDNPYYKMTDAKADPLGYNHDGDEFVDLGLGDFLYPHRGLPAGNIGPHTSGDFLAINGTFKAPTLRNVNQRPDAQFVKVYMHNGVFKTLKDVVHFYNTRSLTSVPGEVIDFTRDNPYAGLQGKPLWPEPEYPSADTLQNPNGAIGSVEAEVGNLGLTDKEENEIVAFLRTLDDGYFTP